jgi:gliding motility-associated-like protein
MDHLNRPVSQQTFFWRMRCYWPGNDRFCVFLQEVKSVILFLGILLGLQVLMPAQVCTGTLGENIFAEGDFGSGTANIPPFNPFLAPGYLYQINPPPNDGYYTITNNIAVWNSNFGWMTIGDNSSNPQGYMMVVNASYDPGLFYQKQVDGLCENTLYEFTVDVHNLIYPGSNLILPNISFLIDGTIRYNSGSVPENGNWNTYGFTFTTLPGQTSISLSLANNAPGGIGNDIALDNISFRPCGPEALVLPEQATNICEDGNPLDLTATIIGSQYPTPQYQWQISYDLGQSWLNIPGANGMVYTHTSLSSGTYYYRYLLANDPQNLLNSKCRVISSVKVVHVIPKYYEYRDSICAGLSYVLGNQVYNASGIYTDSTVSSLGCDSITRLNLVVVPDPIISADVLQTDPSCSYLNDGSIRLGSVRGGAGPLSWLVNEIVYPLDSTTTDLAAGTYPVALEDRFGCRFDSVVNLQSPSPFSIDLSPDWQINLGDSIEVQVVGTYPIVLYAWSPENWTDCVVDCNPLVVQPRRNGYFVLRATSGEGCVASDSVFVEIKEVRNVFVPTAFTPNGDGLNDGFTIWADVPSAQQIDQLQIFDRWGGILFQKQNFQLNDPSQGWDGTRNGKAVPEGVYPYVAWIRFLDSKVFVKSGSVTVLR